MKILTVCGMGSGSSLILKMNVDSILEELGVFATVEACDLGSVGGNPADLIITTNELKPNLEEYNTEKIFVNNVVDKDQLKEKLIKFLNKE